MKKYLYIMLSLLFYAYEVRAQEKFKGRVVDAQSKEPLAGVLIKVNKPEKTILADNNGFFELNLPNGTYQLQIQYLGYSNKSLDITLPLTEALVVRLEANTQELETVQIVSTGYQQIPKERATGSFTVVDQKKLERAVSPNILGRLDGIAPGLLFDKRGGQQNKIQIRGLYTLTEGLAQPLIVLDDFPFEGDINDINPNDIENVTVLRDAAAASIWGARAGNGVIVLSTKKGRQQQPKISYNVSVNLNAKPQLGGLDVMPTSDYIDLERWLFGKGYRLSDTANRQMPALSPVYEILVKQRKGQLSASEANQAIDALRNLDVRNDYLQHYYRRAVLQQHNASIAGGSEKMQYFYALGYNRQLDNLVGNQNQRFNVRANHNFNLSKRLTLQLHSSMVLQNGTNNNPGGYGQLNVNGRQLYPYATFKDANGNANELDIYYRKAFADTLGSGRLPSVKYSPLGELSARDLRQQSNYILAGAAIGYQLPLGLKVDVRYQYHYRSNNSENNQGLGTFYTRRLITQFAQLRANGVNYPVPLGAILDRSAGLEEGHSFRGQLSFNKVWSKHRIDALAGAELRHLSSTSQGYRLYGYDDRLNSANVDFINPYPTFVGSTAIIPLGAGDGQTTDRFVSMFANASYTFMGRYIASFSARRDASNLFGVNINQKWKPLWSAGLKWQLTEEDFMKLPWLGQLSLRASYGFSGNLDPAVTALTIISLNSASSQITNTPYASLNGAPNPNLRWEQVRTFNLGLDFSVLKSRLQGSLDFYRKKSTDVLGRETLDPTTGIASFRTNSANLLGGGLELQLNGLLLNRGAFNWRSNLNISYEHYKVSKYLSTVAFDNAYVSDGASISPLVGYNPYLIVSHAWAGLSASNGDPQGYLSGQLSTDYVALFRNELNQQVIAGPALPPMFGNMLQQFTYGKLSLSANLTFRLGHYFRRSALQYGALFANGAMHSDYLLRWQQPGDELHTSVPSISYPISTNRDSFYKNASVTVASASHIRLQDIRLAYTVENSFLAKLGLAQLQIFAMADNLNVLLWKANSFGLDPQYPNGIKPKATMAMGLKVEFK